MTSLTTIQERYQSAQNSSDLKVVAEIRGDADYIIAAGMSKAELGGKLRSLQAEWDGVSKPRHYTRQDVERIAKEMPRVIVSRSTTQKLRAGISSKQELMDYAGAKALLKNHYTQEMRIIGLRLRSFVEARDAMRNRAMEWGHERPKASDIAHDVLMWWLAPTCQHCGGTKFELMEGTNRLSDRACKRCQGSGHDRCPHGQDGRKMAAWVDAALPCGLGRQRALLMNVLP